LDEHARHSISAITPFAAVQSIIVDVDVAVALAAAAAAAAVRQPKAQPWTAYLLASCQTKL